MLGGIIITKRSPKGHQRVTEGTGLGNTRIRRVPNEEGMLYIKEPDGTFAIYDERGILEKHFATRKEAQAWINYRNREEAASPKIAEHTKQRARQLIAKWLGPFTYCCLD